MTVDQELRDRMRRAVVELPVDCLTYGEIYRIKSEGKRRRQERNLYYDDNDFAREVARLASDRRSDRLRAALGAALEELAGAFTVAEVERLLDAAVEATR